jgi:putative intracellular protease/amidase
MARKKMFTLGAAALLATTGAVFAAVAGAAKAVVFAPIPEDEHAKAIAAMKPPKRARPVAAIIAQNEGTETTDYVVPYSVLAESGIVDVVALATDPGPIRLTPALRIEPQATTAEFDARYPSGADYVIVPKIEDSDDPHVVAWVQAQAAKGAVIVGICSGVKTVSAAGLLADRSATGHWYDIDGLKKENPSMHWVRDRRYVVDRGVVTTTGVSASLPVALAVVEAVGGREHAAGVAASLGVTNWDARHKSDAFGLEPWSVRTVIFGRAAFWDRETYGVPVAEGVDEMALAFTADAWARTVRSRAVAVAARPGKVRTKRGLTVLPEVVAGATQVTTLPEPRAVEAAIALPEALDGIAQRYGTNTASYVALQLEYAWQ